jgi:hypothetical protein
MLAAAALLWGAAAAQAAPLHGEWLGVELSPVWMQVNQRPDFNAASPALFAAGGAGTLRVARLRFQQVYWTPLQLGLGVDAGGDSSLFVQLSTELGARLPLLDDRIEVGGALGAGAVAITYARGCDGDCLVGGGPVVFSPVVRYILVDGPRLPVALFSRAVVPVSSGPLTEHHHGFGMVVMLGLDVGLARL